MDIKIIKEEEYRSQPFVNTDYDMVRATITVPKLNWNIFKRYLHECEKEERKRAEVIAEIFDLKIAERTEENAS